MMTDLDIAAAFTSEGSDKATDHTYDALYGLLVPAILEVGRTVEAPAILEIGYGNGGGIRGFRKLFPGFRLFSMDSFRGLTDPNECTFIFGSTSFAVDLDHATSMLPAGQLALIVDDGSHETHDQVNAARAFWPALASGGIYVIEDLQTTGHLVRMPFLGMVVDFRAVKGRFDDLCFVARKP